MSGIADTADKTEARSKHAPGAHGPRKAMGNPSARSSSPCCWIGTAMGEKWGNHTLPTTRLTSRPSSPTAHSGLHSLHRTIIGQKDYDASIFKTTRGATHLTAGLKHTPRLQRSRKRITTPLSADWHSGYLLIMCFPVPRDFFLV